MLLILNFTVYATQTTTTVLMNPPYAFAYNNQTAKTNLFQTKTEEKNLSQAALLNFNQLLSLLHHQEVEVILLNRDKQAQLPDAVFPNNWFSVLPIKNKQTLILYPMLNPNRREERDVQALLHLLHENKINIEETIDLTSFEKSNQALEGTGSMVFDHDNSLIYASLSPRTDAAVLRQFAQRISFKSLVFHSYDINGNLIYHTNVMMSVGKHFAVLCKECISDLNEQKVVINSLKSSGKELIFISAKQVHALCGNILELQSKKGAPLIIMSDQAFNAFSNEQKASLRKFGKIIHSDIKIIEKVGGGGVRCMLAEIFKMAH